MNKKLFTPSDYAFFIICKKIFIQHILRIKKINWSGKNVIFNHFIQVWSRPSFSYLSEEDVNVIKNIKYKYNLSLPKYEKFRKGFGQKFVFNTFSVLISLNKFSTI